MRSRGASTKRFLLNDRGQIAEGTGENVFVVRDGTLLTNDGSADVLEGITRETVIELARDRGIPDRSRTDRLEEFLGADEIFLTGTAAEVTPVSAVDDLRLRGSSADGRARASLRGSRARRIPSRALA